MEPTREVVIATMYLMWASSNVFKLKDSKENYDLLQPGSYYYYYLFIILVAQATGPIVYDNMVPTKVFVEITKCNRGKVLTD